MGASGCAEAEPQPGETVGDSSDDAAAADLGAETRVPTNQALEDDLGEVGQGDGVVDGGDLEAGMDEKDKLGEQDEQDASPATTCEEYEALPLLLLAAPTQDGTGWVLTLSSTASLSEALTVQLYASLSSGELETEVLDLGMLALGESDLPQSTVLKVESLAGQSLVAWEPSEYAGVIAIHGRVLGGESQSQIGWVHADGLYWRNDEPQTQGAPRVFGEDEFATHRGDLHASMGDLKESPDWARLSRISGQPKELAEPGDEYGETLAQEPQPPYQPGAAGGTGTIGVGLPQLGPQGHKGAQAELDFGLPDPENQIPVATSFPICVEWKVYTDDSNKSFSPDLDTQLGANFDAEDVYRDADLNTGQWGKARYGHLYYREYGLQTWTELWLDSNGCGVVNNSGNVSPLSHQLQIQSEVQSANGNRWRILDLPDGSFNENILPLPPLPGGLLSMTTTKTLTSGASTLVRFDAGSGTPRLHWTPTAVLSWALYREPLGLSGTEVNFRVKQTTDAGLGASSCIAAHQPEKRAYGALGRDAQADSKFTVGHEIGHCLDFLASNESDDRAWGTVQADFPVIINTFRSFGAADPDSVDSDGECHPTTPTLATWTNAGAASGYHQLCDDRRGPKTNPGAVCNAPAAECGDTKWCFGTNPTRSYENSAVALSEGWAQFYATRLFNDRAAQATQTWLVASANSFLLNVDVFVYGCSAYSFRSAHWLTYGGWLGNHCCGHADAAPGCMDGAGTVADWAAALWNLWALKQDGDATCSDTSILHMHAGLDFAHAESNSDKSPSKAWEWYVEGFAPAPTCQENNLVNLIGPRYGIDTN